MIRRITPKDARPGMFVQSFGGSWFQHPFWRTRFLIENEEDAERIRQADIPFVEIDDARGAGVERAGIEKPASATPSPAMAARAAVPARPLRGPEPTSQPQSRAEADQKAAVALMRHSKKIMRRIFERARQGTAPDMAEVDPLVDEISRSVTRNAQALLSVVRLKNKDEYTYFHSVAVCTLVVHLGRHLDLPDGEVRSLGVAGLLHDIGKMGVDDDILNKPGRLDDREFAAVRGHPAFGHGLLTQLPGVPPEALDVCLHHHEKLDGTGYPEGLANEAISRAARMGAICDVYDALTSDRPYKEGWGPAEALAAMWSWEGHFDQRLLLSLMQCLNVFPTGMLVRLRSNRLGIILANPRRGMLPRASAFYCTREKVLIEPQAVVIRDDLAGDQVVSAEKPQYWGLADWEAISQRLLRGEDLRHAA